MSTATGQGFNCLGTWIIQNEKCNQKIKTRINHLREVFNGKKYICVWSSWTNVVCEAWQTRGHQGRMMRRNFQCLNREDMSWTKSITNKERLTNLVLSISARINWKVKGSEYLLIIAPEGDERPQEKLVVYWE